MLKVDFYCMENNCKQFEIISRSQKIKCWMNVGLNYVVKSVPNRTQNGMLDLTSQKMGEKCCFFGFLCRQEMDGQSYKEQTWVTQGQR